MRTLNDYKELLNDDAIDFVSRWTEKKFDSKVFFAVNSGNWLTVCCEYEDIYGKQKKQEEPTCLSLSLKSSGGAKSTFYGDIRHFIKIKAADIRRKRTGKYIENAWFNYEYICRIENVLRCRYNICL